MSSCSTDLVIVAVNSLLNLRVEPAMLKTSLTRVRASGRILTQFSRRNSTYNGVQLDFYVNDDDSNA